MFSPIPLFKKGDLIVDKESIPDYTVGIIYNIILDDLNDEIIYELMSPDGILFWSEGGIIEGIIHGSTKIHKRIKY